MNFCSHFQSQQLAVTAHIKSAARIDNYVCLSKYVTDPSKPLSITISMSLGKRNFLFSIPSNTKPGKHHLMNIFEFCNAEATAQAVALWIKQILLIGL
jgi:hypothetical protein